jgi:hypothetical protein
MEKLAKLNEFLVGGSGTMGLAWFGVLGAINIGVCIIMKSERAKEET